MDLQLTTGSGEASTFTLSSTHLSVSKPELLISFENVIGLSIEDYEDLSSPQIRNISTEAQEDELTPQPIVTRVTLHYFTTRQSSSNHSRWKFLLARTINSVKFSSLLSESLLFRSELLSRLISLQSFDSIGRRILIFANPISGTKSSLSVCERLLPLMRSRGLLPTVHYTEPAPHTFDFVMNFPKEELTSFDVIACFSGDGTPHQILNGIQQRNDLEGWVPTLILFPTGSGCALAENTTKLSAIENSVENALFLLLNPRRMKMPLFRVRLFKQKQIFKDVWSFLFTNYGYLADLNKESECLRFLGDKRFRVYGYYKLASRFMYQAQVILPKETIFLGENKWEIDKSEKLTEPVEIEKTLEENEETPTIFLQHNMEVENEKLPAPEGSVEQLQDLIRLTPDFYNFYCSFLPFITKGHLSSPCLWENLGEMDTQVFLKESGKWGLVKYLLAQHQHTPGAKGAKVVEPKSNWVRVIVDPNQTNIMIDGESYEDDRCEEFQIEKTDRFFYVLW